jgi:hypothetical protein
MAISRRDALKLLGGCVASGSINIYALAGPKQSPPRMPLEEFVQNDGLLKALRRGVRAMKKRKQSDPLGWFYQAAIHGVTTPAVEDATAQDPGVANVDQKRFWSQCPHQGQNSANFLPWHRAYTYHFEKILRMHSECDKFSLPYWNYTAPCKPENRVFPREFGILHLDGNPANNDDANLNPLYHPDRDRALCEWEMSFGGAPPLLTLSDAAVDIRLPMAAAVFFGETETDGLAGGIADDNPLTRGLLERYPHDQVHLAVGGIASGTDALGNPVIAFGAMAKPPTAAFDPSFSVHHSNIDRLWAAWSCLPGKSWGKAMPPSPWFNERPWFFYDPDGTVVNKPRKAYFDYRALGVRFKYIDERCNHLTLPDVDKAAVAVAAERVRKVELLAQLSTPIGALPVSRAVIPVPGAAAEKLRAPARALREGGGATRGEERLLLRLPNASPGFVRGTGLDVHLTDNPNGDLRRSDPSFVGSVSLFRHAPHPAAAGGAHGATDGGLQETFDVTRAVAGTKSEALDGLSLVIVPYPLLALRGKGVGVPHNREVLKASGMEFLRMQLR